MDTSSFVSLKLLVLQYLLLLLRYASVVWKMLTSNMTDFNDFKVVCLLSGVGEGMSTKGEEESLG